MLTNDELQFIIACKSKLPIKELIILYKELYYDTNNEQEIANGLISILSTLCNKYYPIKDIFDVIKQLDPNKYVKYDDLLDFDYKNEVINMLINKIRFTL